MVHREGKEFSALHNLALSHQLYLLQSTICRDRKHFPTRMAQLVPEHVSPLQSRYPVCSLQLTDSSCDLRPLLSIAAASQHCGISLFAQQFAASLLAN